MKDEQLIVFAGHGNVEVVVPRYEPSVAYGPQHGTVVDVVVQTVLTAHPVNRHEVA
jgi:hypothetical protein